MVLAATGAAAIAGVVATGTRDVPGNADPTRSSRAISEPTASQYPLPRLHLYLSRAGESRPAPGLSVADPGAVGHSLRAGASTRGGARWRWPILPRPLVLRPFRSPPSPYSAGHRGLDLAAVDGTVVHAVESGTVSHAGSVAGRGSVTVTHVGGLRSTYEPVDPVVVAGAGVSAGDVLGTVKARDGPAHCGPRACLHLGARRAGGYVDPHPLLTGGRLALLPLR